MQILQPASIFNGYDAHKKFGKYDRSVSFTRGAAQRHSSYIAMNQFLNKLPSCKAMSVIGLWCQITNTEFDSTTSLQPL